MFEKTLTRVFRKKQYEFREAFSEFSKSLTLIADLDQLKDNVIAKIREIIRVDTIYIFLLNQDSNSLELAEGRGSYVTQNRHIYFDTGDPLIQWFAVNETYLLVSRNPAVFSYFAGHEQAILKELQIDLIFPLLVMNRITGLVCMGAKSDSNPYTRDEIELLNTLLGQAAFAFENAYLYHQQKTRLKKMYRADRLATIGQLAAGAAHEIRNPLTSIRSTVQYLQKGLTGTDKSALVEDLIEEVDRINEIIEGMLSFSKPTKPRIESVDLKGLIEQTINLFATTARKKNITVSFSFNAHEQMLKADPSQLKQVFLNIIMNATQAMERSGELSIAVVLKKPAEFQSHSHGTFHIIIKDTGEGIPQKDLEHIFDPFFTTKKDGTGLGLSISYSIIQQHYGDIEIESFSKKENPDKHGTTVRIMLPILK